MFTKVAILMKFLNYAPNRYLYTSLGSIVLGVLLYLVFKVTALPNDLLAILAAITGAIWSFKVIRGQSKLWLKVLTTLAGIIYLFLLLLGIIGLVQNV